MFCYLDDFTSYANKNICEQSYYDADYVAEWLDTYSSKKIINLYEGSVFIVGNSNPCDFEPLITSERLFMSVVPGNTEYIDVLVGRWLTKLIFLFAKDSYYLFMLLGLNNTYFLVYWKSN